MATCHDCNGDGECSVCNSTGKIEPDIIETLGNFATGGLLDRDDWTCGHCKGSGTCPTCHGKGEY
jgi:hypothetical protein